MASESLPMDAVDTIRRRVQSAIEHSSLGILGAGLCWNLIRLRRLIEQIELAFSDVDVRTEDERKFLLEVAKPLQGVANTLSVSSDRLATIERPVILRSVAMRLFDAVIIDAEDLAETLALGASAEFANFVHEELKRFDKGRESELA